MTWLLLLCLILLFGGQRSSACPDLCSCKDGQVDCSGRSLTSTSIPTSFPSGTISLLLHDNLLTTIPNQLLDDLTSLQSEYPSRRVTGVPPWSQAWGWGP
uniref:LRRNT domain-containing protein n=1 Tax=Nothobranchius furzeri TaxID=105023 RepID=A0A8C6M3N8_NOTFU